MSFRNTTKKPYIPTIAVTPKLWERIGGENWECIGGVHTPDDRPLGATAMLAARFLQRPSEDTELVGKVKELLKETKSIADDCLAKKDGADGRYFEPQVVRALQLVQYLEKRVEIEVNGVALEGVLLYYESRIITEEEHEYMLGIYFQPMIDGLPVIHHTISSRSWFKGSSGVRFVEQAAVDSAGALPSSEGIISDLR
ncbi:hypothetical protein K505DRAFT_366291 [Melanomma pulvis-pyrius CBS 109.77]|uniref:Uncharacterized protein n=1 Tax=Melanomma pulvis-pyrius CBS 109.77 TaxID=1314802 RepID=A0A6A6WXM1_9PLEO|nr:hypothetical protein K505DRAFT_366291 [Melanomma pulvis-pyrius CBS 109.77]